MELLLFLAIWLGLCCLLLPAMYWANRRWQQYKVNKEKWDKLQLKLVACHMDQSERMSALD